MDQLFDAMLVVISGSSALYCYMVGRRLRALHNLRKGMGKAVAQMTQSISAVETHATKLNRETTTTVAQLAAMLARVDAYEEKVDLILETMDTQARQTWKEYQSQAHRASTQVNTASDQLHELIGDAKSLAALMNKQILAMAEVADRQQALLDALKRSESRKVAAQREAAPVREKTVADMRGAAEARAVAVAASMPAATPPAEAAQATPRPAARPQRPWANEAAAATASTADPAPAKASRVAELAKRIAAERTAEIAARKANPFVRDVVKKAAT